MQTLPDDSSNDSDLDGSYLSGQLLIAMPGMQDPRFEKSVIYICAHNDEGAMGLLINRPIESLTFPELLEQLEITPPTDASHALGAEKPIRVLFGGPVEQARGFVLHSPDYLQDASMAVDENIALTATTDILKAIADGKGPTRCLLALGYAGWGPGQLDVEIKSNGWLNVDADEKLIFGTDLDDKWEQAMAKIGVDPLMLSDDVGHA